MRLKNIFIVSLLLVFVSCVQDDGLAPNTSASGGTTASSKATLSSWATSNAAWAIRLDLNGANIGGTDFTLVVKFSDTSETTCANSSLSGSEDFGTYITGSCTVNPSGSSMSNVIGVAPFQTVGSGTYTNNGSSIVLCKANNSCSTYY